MYFQHPYLYPVEFATINDTCGISIHKFEEKGTLRDVICKVWYDNAWDGRFGICFPLGKFLSSSDMELVFTYKTCYFGMLFRTLICKYRSETDACLSLIVVIVQNISLMSFYHSFLCSYASFLF